jgi:flagellar biosynthetic protein FliO
MSAVSLSFLGVILLLATALWALQRFSPGKKARRLEVVESATLGPGKTLALVEVEKRRFLLAAGQHGVSLIAEFEFCPRGNEVPARRGAPPEPDGRDPQPAGVPAAMGPL